MRAVIDTNVLVSAIILPKSKLGEIFPHIRSSLIVPLYHSNTLAELVRVLGSRRIQKSFQLTSADIDVAVELMVRHGELIVPTDHFALCRDAKDDVFLDIAFAGQAEVIVSGDQDLLVLHPFGNISIIKPHDFLFHLSETQPAKDDSV